MEEPAKEVGDTGVKSFKGTGEKGTEPEAVEQMGAEARTRDPAKDAREAGETGGANKNARDIGEPGESEGGRVAVPAKEVGEGEDAT